MTLDQNASRTLDVEHLLARLTLAEKASLLSGAGVWTTQPVERDGETWVPGVAVADGPHGVRKHVIEGDHLGLAGAVPATCFPTAAALASSWDRDLVGRVGEALGREARANEVAVLLGPGVNIKRSPLCGRNFEYFSEDPVLSGELAVALVEGIQSQGVGAALKHLAANNQESDRMRVSAEVDERTLREIYLPAFERVVTRARPWTVMCSYNRINGTYTGQDPWLLTEVLRDEWGFDGLVVSDWGAVRDRVAALAAGLDLEMPATGGRTAAEVVAAVTGGALDEAVVDRAARRVLRLVERSVPALGAPGTFDVGAHHALARVAAAAGVVLLKNDPVLAADDQAVAAPLLPLAAGDRLAVVGELARTPRYQGAGSSQVTPTRLDDALTALRDAAGADLPFAPGYTVAEGPADERTPDALVAEAVDVASAARTVVVFLGLPAADEAEGYDREHLDLPADQVALLRAVAAANPRVVVVLAGGSVISVSGWQDEIPALVLGWLGGQAGGSGVADVLTGAVEPSGRLPETIPLRLEDNPSYGNFPGELGRVRYGEGVLVGYRWYDARRTDVAYPFGHGLSYTSFAYDDVRARVLSRVTGSGADATVRARVLSRVTGSGAEATVRVQARVTNTGARAGAEVVQVYVGDPDSQVQRPVRELKAFTRVELAPGASQVVTLDLDARDLSYWHPVLRRWVVEGGEFVVEVGSSSRDVRAAVVVDVAGEDVTLPLHELSTLAEALAHPVAGPLLQPAVDGVSADPVALAMAADMPLVVIADLGLAGFDRRTLAQLVQAANAAG
ncbi:glycoside hydrolase family 3 C-terminal domain-containing protein [Isoptericola sp. NEAU-Y5]|uniref:Glycoside hydrolase family 3 C-terminal domain-containing protein n=1 Tax=Isoptericola luteus TaxID=2879484 RepID=A0ABS7ZHB8_9MICO|nr:glycoside hydrolase family 3 C-terminal domain-containing protein [Isoptericola sp. NEAU-Y5]MCA5893210.1 glycoside hydrolase family 3 C-terminal domain-containing protein [Isoptericola sp. NEAU-Y5]